MLTLKQGSRVRWYVFALGDVNDLHTPHWHGNNVFVSGQRDDVVNLLPATQVRFLERTLFQCVLQGAYVPPRNCTLLQLGWCHERWLSKLTEQAVSTERCAPAHRPLQRLA